MAIFRAWVEMRPRRLPGSLTCDPSPSLQPGAKAEARRSPPPGSSLQRIARQLRGARSSGEKGQNRSLCSPLVAI